ncbi:MAG: protein tyrosine phosphatase family protein [Betaproteobacteria bacterium]|nr:protein tyrosine phosphatase family protein [Betaproteobacteria bacterium]
MTRFAGVSLLAALQVAAAPALEAPNVVEISPRITTSGQPSATALGKLKEQGYGAVIYLAPPTVRDAVADEHLIVARQGLVFINIPIRFDGPTEADFDAFSAALGGLADRRVLVHCQVNMRASSFVFLYRTIVLKDDPKKAYDAVEKVWVPDGPWRRLIDLELKKHHVDFEIL